jgi:hypothetical protein
VRRTFLRYTVCPLLRHKAHSMGAGLYYCARCHELLDGPDDRDKGDHVPRLPFSGVWA